MGTMQHAPQKLVVGRSSVSYPCVTWTASIVPQCSPIVKGVQRGAYYHFGRRLSLCYCPTSLARHGLYREDVSLDECLDGRVFYEHILTNSSYSKLAIAGGLSWLDLLANACTLTFNLFSPSPSSCRRAGAYRPPLPSGEGIARCKTLLQTRVIPRGPAAK